MKPQLIYLIAISCIAPGCQKENENFKLLSERHNPAIYQAEDSANHTDGSIADQDTWIMSSPLVIARSRHTTTLLPDGGILVAGGYTGQLHNPITTETAELYNPVTGTWSMTGSMSFPRSNHTATRLADGMVLVVGGRHNNMAIATTELYDANTGSWTTTGQLNHPRFFHTATLLENGNVLVTGGLSSDGAPYGKTAEVYDPVTGAWSSVDHMATLRWGHSATLLANGNVLVAGGTSPAGDGVYTPRSEIYDPAENVWRNAGNLNTARGFHAAVRLGNGSVLVTGGLTLPIQLQNVTNTAECFVPETGKWTPAGSMAFERIPGAYGAVLLTDGRVLVAGGRTATAESYEAEAGTWTILPSLNIPRSFHTVTCLSDGTVLVVGGENQKVITASVEMYTPVGMESE